MATGLVQQTHIGNRTKVSQCGGFRSFCGHVEQGFFFFFCVYVRSPQGLGYLREPATMPAGWRLFAGCPRATHPTAPLGRHLTSHRAGSVSNTWLNSRNGCCNNSSGAYLINSATSPNSSLVLFNFNEWIAWSSSTRVHFGSTFTTSSARDVGCCNADPTLEDFHWRTSRR